MGITYREPGTEDVPKILKLLGDNDPQRRHFFTEKYWQWQFVQIPCGSICRVALDGDNLAGFGALLGFDALVDGQAQMVYEGAEFVVAKPYRGRGVFSRLAGDLYRSIEGRFSTYAFASPMSFCVYRSRLKHRFCGRFPYWIGFTDIAELGRRKAGAVGGAAGSALAFLGLKTVKEGRRYEIRRLASFGDEWKSIGNRVGEDRFHLLKDQRYLNWRYFDHPFNRYTIIGAYRGSEPSGYAVTKGQDIIDLRHQDNDTMGALLNEIVVRGRQAGTLSVNTYLATGPEERRILRRHGFFEASRLQGGLTKGSLYPVQRTMIGPGSASGQLPGIGYWCFTMGDMDCKL